MHEDCPFSSCGTYYERTDYASLGTPYANRAPWAVSLGDYKASLGQQIFVYISQGYYEKEEYVHTCTGTIITDVIVITAAHCTTEIEE